MEVGRPLEMLMTAVSRHRRLRWQLCQLHLCLLARSGAACSDGVEVVRCGATGSDGAEVVRCGATRSDGALVCAVKRLARVERWLR